MKQISINNLKIYLYQKTTGLSPVKNTHARDQKRTVQRDKTVTLLMPLHILTDAVYVII